MSEHGTLGKLIIQSLEEAIAYERGELTDVRVTRFERREDGSVERVETRGEAVISREVLPPGRWDRPRKAFLEGPPWYPPHSVREIRHKLSVSQAIFAQMLGVSASTVRAWEQGRREPEGAARRLLQMADLHPDVLEETCGPIRPATEGARTRSRTVKAPAPPRAQRLAADTDAS
jgi:DNA-binding transcriptional regulator YiaG